MEQQEGIKEKIEARYVGGNGIKSAPKIEIQPQETQAKAKKKKNLGGKGGRAATSTRGSRTRSARRCRTEESARRRGGEGASGCKWVESIFTSAWGAHGLDWFLEAHGPLHPLQAQIPPSPGASVELYRGRHGDRSHSDPAVGRTRPAAARQTRPAASRCGDKSTRPMPQQRCRPRRAPPSEGAQLSELELRAPRDAPQVLAAVRPQAMLRNARCRRENEHRKLLARRDAARRGGGGAAARLGDHRHATRCRRAADAGRRAPLAPRASRRGRRRAARRRPPPRRARASRGRRGEDGGRLRRHRRCSARGGPRRFMAACRAEHSEENLEFWLAAQAHAAIADAAARRADAAAIVDRRAHGAAAQVNPPAKIRSAARDARRRPHAARPLRRRGGRGFRLGARHAPPLQGAAREEGGGRGGGGAKDGGGGGGGAGGGGRRRARRRAARARADRRAGRRRDGGRRRRDGGRATRRPPAGLAARRRRRRDGGEEPAAQLD